MSIQIAIDGPSGAGKSTAARVIAKRMGFLYIDTGALYRAIGLFCLRSGVADRRDEAAVKALLPEIRLELVFREGEQRVLLCGEDVSDEIRTQPVAQAASDVSALPAVRAFLLDLQRDLAERHDVVMDGRDIGTVILPEADVKIFLTASAAHRARRRVAELRAKGIEADEATVLKEIELRDHNDSTRAIAPLRPAEDAVLLDNSEMDLNQTADAICQIIEERVGACSTKS